MSYLSLDYKHIKYDTDSNISISFIWELGQYAVHYTDNKGIQHCCWCKSVEFNGKCR